MTIGPRTGDPHRDAVPMSRLTLRRIAAARRRFAALPRPDAVPAAASLLSALLASLRTLPRPVRDQVLAGPDIRGFLAEAGTWLEVGRLSRGAAIVPSRLFDRISRTQYLVTLVPRGRLDPGFAARCRRFARGRLEAACFDLGAFVLGLRLAHPRPGTLIVPLRFAEEAEQGRPGDRIDLGTLSGPTGALGIVLGGAGRGRRVARTPASSSRLRASLDGARLTLETPGGVRVIVPGAGTPLRAPDLERGTGGGRVGSVLRIVRRAVLPGTSILLAPTVLSAPRRLRVLKEAPDPGRRLTRALLVVRVAWPEAAREIARRTFMIVPIREPGTVSYSMAARPGVSFINVTGKSLVDLADDLLHETAHHRLHDLQWGTALLKPGPEAEEVQAFDSPWRGTRRPLHGLLHGAYTFLFRADLFRRILRARGSLELSGVALGAPARRFVRREAARERRMIRSALRDLERASRAGLLTPPGRRLVRWMRRWSGEQGRG